MNFAPREHLKSEGGPKPGCAQVEHTGVGAGKVCGFENNHERKIGIVYIWGPPLFLRLWMPCLLTFALRGLPI